MTQPQAKPHTLIYFVEEIETSFVIHDLINLARRFDRVYLFSGNKIPDKSKVPSNVQLHEAYMDWKSYGFLKVLLANFLLVFGVLVSEMWQAKKWIPLRKNLASLLLNIFKADAVYAQLRANGMQTDEISNTPFYAFWFYDTSYLGVLRRKYGVRKTIARAHSGDLYEDHASRVKRSDLRHFQLGTLSHLLPVSQQGSAYMAKTYPAFSERIHTVYLGTRDGGLNPHQPDKLLVFSCARFNNHKRLDKIAQALLHTKVPVTWIHIGDERLGQDIPGMPEYMALKQQLEQHPNIEVKPTGALENNAIFSLYREQAASVFISLSENEGIPVSIMEAISFGVPVIATNAGGCREIVQPETGVLLPVNIDPVEVAAMLDGFLTSEMNTPKFRAGVRRFWEEHFSESQNYTSLMHYLS
jgi:glycosyltransferase involved in cell wall biosynthesis